MMGGGAQDDDFDNPKNEDISMENEGSNPSVSTGSSATFPLARIKKIMKADKDVNLVSADAVNLISVATEMFLDSFVKKASEISQNEKRRTILYKDFGKIMKMKVILFIIFFLLASAVKQDIRYSFLHGNKMCFLILFLKAMIELIPEMVSVQMALEAQKHHGIVPSFTPAHSPVMDTDDHFDSFKSSTSNVGSAHSNQNSHSSGTNNQQASSIKSSKSDFFAKRTPGNVNFLLNSNSTMIGESVAEEESIDISDDTH